MNQHNKPQSIAQRADELEEEMMHELERVVTRSTLHYLADGEIRMDTTAAAWAKNPKAIFNMGPTRLPPMPEKPTRSTFPLPFRLMRICCRAPPMHSRPDTRGILACLLHDIGG